jgi:hypothetical protein
MLDGRIWVVAPVHPKFLTIRRRACNSLISEVPATPSKAKDGHYVEGFSSLFFCFNFSSVRIIAGVFLNSSTIVQKESSAKFNLTKFTQMVNDSKYKSKDIA